MFHIDPYVSPYAAQVTALVGGADRVRAEGIQRAGAATAQGVQQAGALAGQTMNTFMQYQAQAPQRELVAQQVAANKRGLAFSDAVNSIIESAMTQRPDGSRVIDRDKLRQSFATSKVPLPLQEQTFKSLDEVDASIQKFQQVRIDHVADLSHAALQSPFGSTPSGFAAIAALAKANGLVTDEQLQPILQAVDQGADLKTVLTNVRGLSEKYKDVSKPTFAPRESPGYYQGGEFKPLTSNAKPEAGVVYKDAGGVEHPVTFNGKDYLFNGKVVTDAVTRPTPTPAPKSLQKSSVLLDGKPADVLVDPDPAATQKVFDLEGKPITNAASRVKPAPTATQINLEQRNNLPPGDWGKTGAEFLATIPKQWQTTVRKIANYEEDPTKVASMRGGMRETLSQWVNQVNPAYKADEFAARGPMRKAFTSGPQGQAINSLNTAIGHLDQFVNVAQALANGSFQPGNAAFNWFKKTFGDSAPTNFKGLTAIMSGELASAFKKSGATDQEIKEVQSAVDSKESPKQLIDYATQIAIPALGSKIASYDTQFKQVMGADDSFKILLPDAERVLTKYGFDPQHPTIGATPPVGAGITVKSPSGKAYTFKSQAEADAAVAAAKEKGLWK